MSVNAINNTNPCGCNEGGSNPGTEFAQNNKALWLNYGNGLDGQPVNAISVINFLNGMAAPLVISEIQTPVRIAFLRMTGGILYRYLYEFTQGKGTYGTAAGGTSVNPQWVKFFSHAPATISDFENAPNTVQINLGVLANQDAFLGAANSEERDLNNTANQYYFIYTVADAQYSKRFKVEVYAGDYGGSWVDQLTDEMFVSGPGSVAPDPGPPQIIKNLWAHVRLTEDATEIYIPEMIGADALLQISVLNTTYTKPELEIPGLVFDGTTGKIYAAAGFFMADERYNINYLLP